MTTQATVPPGWYPDPAARHQYRYWDGSTWTDQASDAGQVVIDVPSPRPAPRQESVTAEPLSAPVAEPVSEPVTEEVTEEVTEPVPAPRYGGPGAAPPPVQRRSGGRWLLFGGLAVAAVLALVAGLLVWSPWTGGGPARPTGLSSSFPTATSVRISWSAPADGAGVDRFLVQRDGTTVGTVSGTAASYVDQDLSSASKHSYVVFAVADGDRSEASSTLNIRMPSPLPTRVRIAGVSPTSVTVSWAPPAEGTPPTAYAIFRGDQLVATVSGNRTSYLDKGLSPATRYAYSVAASWGDQSADLYSTAPINARTGTPSLGSARLAGTWTVATRIVRSGGGSVSVGDRFTDTWQFRPTCRSGACDVRVSGTIGGSSYITHKFHMTLQQRPGGVYSGSTTAHITHCGSLPTQQDVRNGVQVTINIRKGSVDGSTWSAKKWQGSMTVTSPYVQATPTTYCPAQSFTGDVRAQR